MFLVDNFKIILLVGLVCTAGNAPSTALKCYRWGVDPKLGLMDIKVRCIGEDAVCLWKYKNSKCSTKAECPLDGKDVYCLPPFFDPRTTYRTCCCTIDYCNTGRPDGPAYEKLCEYKNEEYEYKQDDHMQIQNCPTQEQIEAKKKAEKERKEAEEKLAAAAAAANATAAGGANATAAYLICYQGTGKTITCSSSTEVCSVKAIPTGGMASKGESGCMEQKECKKIGSIGYVCSTTLCCCNTDYCNRLDDNGKHFVEFCKAAKISRSCPDKNDIDYRGDASGLFQRYYGGFPFAVLVAASLYYFPLEAFF